MFCFNFFYYSIYQDLSGAMTLGGFHDVIGSVLSIVFLPALAKTTPKKILSLLFFIFIFFSIFYYYYFNGIQ